MNTANPQIQRRTIMLSRILNLLCATTLCAVAVTMFVYSLSAPVGWSIFMILIALLAFWAALLILEQN